MTLAAGPLLAISALATVGSGIVSFMGAQSAAAAQEEAGNAAVAAADYNARVREQRAREAINASNAEASMRRRQLLGQFGTALTTYGKSGVQIEGTPMSQVSDLASEIELDAKLTRYKGVVEARDNMSAAEMERWEGAQRRSAFYSQAGATRSQGFGSLISSIGSAAGTATKINF